MCVVDNSDQFGPLRECVDEVGVGILDEFSRVRCAHRRGEVRGVIDRVDRREPFASADFTVDLAERGREMHDARAVIDGHEVVANHSERFAWHCDELERRLVMGADQLPGRDVADHPGDVAEDRPDPIAGQHQVASTIGRADPDVRDVGTDRRADVRRERPRRGRPHEEVDVPVE